MKPFLTEDFLLQTQTARVLYHDFAENMPIFDYHCHLPVAEIAADKTFENLTDIWLRGDHYKWRAMRANGIAERMITGDAGDFEMARGLARFLDALERQDRLAKTILYVVNPRDNEVVAAAIGAFQDGSFPGKMQFGSAWWFNDRKDGIERQINTLSNMGLLSRFVGMLTEARSFLSYPRHEYFRRVLCLLLGNDVENGALPDDMENV